MVVVPTSEQVTMEFARQWPELVGNALTVVALIGFGLLASKPVMARIRRRGGRGRNAIEGE